MEVLFVQSCAMPRRIATAMAQRMTTTRSMAAGASATWALAAMTVQPRSALPHSNALDTEQRPRGRMQPTAVCALASHQALGSCDMVGMVITVPFLQSATATITAMGMPLWTQIVQMAAHVPVLMGGPAMTAQSLRRRQRRQSLGLAIPQSSLATAQSSSSLNHARHGRQKWMHHLEQRSFCPRVMALQVRTLSSTNHATMMMQMELAGTNRDATTHRLRPRRMPKSSSTVPIRERGSSR